VKKISKPIKRAIEGYFMGLSTSERQWQASKLKELSLQAMRLSRLSSRNTSTRIGKLILR